MREDGVHEAMLGSEEQMLRGRLEWPQ